MMGRRQLYHPLANSYLRFIAVAVTKVNGGTSQGGPISINQGICFDLGEEEFSSQE
jgi:hypothetical protein